jgi:dTDP-4-dehydrorhamnose reductase
VSNILVIGRGFIGTKLYAYLAEKKRSVISISQKIVDYTNEQDLVRYLE